MILRVDKLANQKIQKLFKLSPEIASVIERVGKENQTAFVEKCVKDEIAPKPEFELASFEKLDPCDHRLLLGAKGYCMARPMAIPKRLLAPEQCEICNHLNLVYADPTKFSNSAPQTTRPEPKRISTESEDWATKAKRINGSQTQNNYFPSRSFK